MWQLKGRHKTKRQTLKTNDMRQVDKIMNDEQHPLFNY